MANITRIKAHDYANPREDDSSAKAPKPPKTEKSAPADKKADKKAQKLAQKASKSKSGKKPFISIRPFVAFGRYLRDSWRELRQVRWPNRKVTWKMVLAVFIYTALFITLLVLLDILFDWIFSLILK